MHGKPDSSPGSVPPTLRPFLDNLPPPTSIQSDSQTPKGKSIETFDHGEPTPTKAFFDVGHENEEEDEDSLNDDEFEYHYSRHSSPASSAESDEFEPDNTSHGDGGYNAPETGQMHRVSSLPVAPPRDSNTQHSILHTSRSTTALSRAAPPIPPPLYPPFYGRPPTPLPPSPSLTSLLRPPSLLNRSTTSTRPTTPDSSDVETPNDTEAAVAHSARRANPLPPAAPKVPTYEYYGFVLYLASSLLFLIYILWSYLPSPFLHAMGITYYPNRWWSLAIPAWIVMVLIYIYIALACWNVEYLTLGMQRVETMVDEAGNVAILDENGRIRKGGSKRYVAEIEERKKREALSQSWSKKGRSGGGGRGSRKDKKKEKSEEWCGYTGEVVENGVASGLTWRQIWNEGTDAVMDVPIGGVCEVLYGDGRDAP